MTNCIHFVHFTCLTVLSYNLSPGPLWSSSWSWTLNFILHTFLHPIIIFVSQHMPVPTQPVLLQYLCYVIYTWSLSLNSLPWESVFSLNATYPPTECNYSRCKSIVRLSLIRHDKHFRSPFERLFSITFVFLNRFFFVRCRVFRARRAIAETLVLLAVTV